jgi:hypothetical protein
MAQDGIHYIFSVADEIVIDRDLRGGCAPLLYIQMPLPKVAGEARQVAILFGSTPRYFLEEFVASDPEISFLCEKNRQGTHLNFGKNKPMTKDEFISYVRTKTDTSAA